MSKVRTKLSEQLWAEAIRLGKDRFQARACIPCQDTDTDRLLTRAADTIDTLTAERDELREIVGRTLDGIPIATLKHLYRETRTTGKIEEHDVVIPLARATTCHGIDWTAIDCYSTREAAERAGGEG